MADHHPPLAYLAKALYHMRATAGLKQVELAERSGVARAMISAYESGSKRPSVDSLERLLVGLDSTVDDLARALREVARRRAAEEGREGDPRQRLLLRMDAAAEQLQRSLDQYHRAVRDAFETAFEDD